jgi:hypothetical protein
MHDVPVEFLWWSVFPFAGTRERVAPALNGRAAEKSRSRRGEIKSIGGRGMHQGQDLSAKMWPHWLREPFNILSSSNSLKTTPNRRTSGCGIQRKIVFGCDDKFPH